MLSIETAGCIREALGPGSITFQSMTAEEIAEDFETFQRERRYKNSYHDWLSGILTTEQIHLADEPVANLDELLDQMQRRLYAVKKGDEMKKVKKSTKADANVGSDAKPRTQSPTRKGPAKKAASTTSTPAPVETAAIEAPRAETSKVDAAAKVEAPKVGDPQLATEADFASPSHPRLSDYRYYAMVDRDNRVVGRGFLARVDTAPRRSWFALRNDEQTALWETSKWTIREIDFDLYKKLTLAYLNGHAWPAWVAVKAMMNQAQATQVAA